MLEQIFDPCDPAFWNRVAKVMFTPERKAAADLEARQMIDLVSALLGRRPTSALELGCGNGNHAIAMAKLGVEVVGVDICQEFIEQASKRVLAEQAPAKFVLADAREFVKNPPNVDMVFTAFTSIFGYLRHPETISILKSLHSLIMGRGALLIESASKSYVDNLSPSVVYSGDGEFVVRRVSTAGNISRFAFKILRQDSSKTYSTEIEVLTQLKLSGLLNEAGFSEVAFYGSLDGVPYTEGLSERMIAVARP